MNEKKKLTVYRKIGVNFFCMNLTQLTITSCDSPRHPHFQNDYDYYIGSFDEHFVGVSRKSGVVVHRQSGTSVIVFILHSFVRVQHSSFQIVVSMTVLMGRHYRHNPSSLLGSITANRKQINTTQSQDAIYLVVNTVVYFLLTFHGILFYLLIVRQFRVKIRVVLHDVVLFVIVIHQIVLFYFLQKIADNYR